MTPACETQRLDAAQAHEENEKAKKLLKEGALSAASSRLEQSLLCAGTALGHDSWMAIERLRDLADFNDGINNHESTLGAAADACMRVGEGRMQGGGGGGRGGEIIAARGEGREGALRSRGRK